MAHNTRSHSSVSIDSDTDRKQKTLGDREKPTEHIDANSLFDVLSKIQTELSRLRGLPEQVSNLEQRVNEASRAASAYDECADLPEQEEPPVITPTLKIKDVVANIPPFNGYKISIFQFARACERARDLLPSVQESQLVQFIINKIEGDAYQVIEGNVYTRVVDLLDKLKNIFAPNKSVAQYRGELANAYKSPNETVLKYAGRIKDLKLAILDGNRRQGINNPRLFNNEIEGEVLEAFVNGLPSNVITRMEHRNIGTLDEAIEWAVKITRNLEIEKQRERQFMPRQFPVTRADINNPRPAEPEQPKSILKNAANTFVPRPWIRPLIPGQLGPNSPGICNYCKIPGHRVAECRKLAYRNAMQASGNAEGRPTVSATREPAQATAHPITVQTEPTIAET